MECGASSQCYFGANTIAENPTYGLLSIYRGFLEIVGPYTVLGNGQYHWYADFGATIIAGPESAATWTNASSYEALAIANGDSLISANAIKFKSTVLGKKYVVTNGAGITAASKLPGSLAGLFTPPGSVQ
jgi:hypothetical protein